MFVIGKLKGSPIIDNLIPLLAHNLKHIVAKIHAELVVKDLGHLILFEALENVLILKHIVLNQNGCLDDLVRHLAENGEVISYCLLVPLLVLVLLRLWEETEVVGLVLISILYEVLHLQSH